MEGFLQEFLDVRYSVRLFVPLGASFLCSQTSRKTLAGTSIFAQKVPVPTRRVSYIVTIIRSAIRGDSMILPPAGRPNVIPLRLRTAGAVKVTLL